MRIAADDKQLTLYFEGRVDSANAPETEKLCLQAVAEHPGLPVVADMEALKFISSAGLRVLLKLHKAAKLTLINVKPDVWEILEMTGMSEMLTVERAFRTISVKGCPVIGRGAKGTVYRWKPDAIVKVYDDPDNLPAIRAERARARRAFVMGIPTAIPYDVVRVDDRYGTVFELLDADSFSRLIAAQPEKAPEYVRMVAELLRLLHTTHVDTAQLPEGLEMAMEWLEAARGYLPQGVISRLQKLLEDLPKPDTLLHGDFHTNNLMLQNGEALLIDMDTLAWGHPVLELANIYITYVGFGESDPSKVEGFLNMPYELACRVWKLLLADYLGTQDAAVLESVENKAHLLSSLRLMRHVSSRPQLFESEKGRAAFEQARKEVTELLEKVDTLDFSLPV